MSKSKIDITQLFTMTHFRWSFYSCWDLIGDTLGKICAAFQHHSMSLCECPLPVGEWEDREGGIFRERGLYFTSDKTRYGPYLYNWSKIKPALNVAQENQKGNQKQ